MKKLLVLIVAVIFTLSIAAMGFAADVVKGTVSKVEGNNVTIKTKDGDKTVPVLDGKGIKVGEKIIVRDGKVKKATEGC
jgi:uncharacterized protein YxeA